jgi:hypothetical protein
MTEVHEWESADDNDEDFIALQPQFQRYQRSAALARKFSFLHSSRLSTNVTPTPTTNDGQACVTACHMGLGNVSFH